MLKYTDTPAGLHVKVRCGMLQERLLTSAHSKLWE